MNYAPGQVVVYKPAWTDGPARRCLVVGAGGSVLLLDDLPEDGGAKAGLRIACRDEVRPAEPAEEKRA